MKIAIITNAGISSRFNERIPEAEKKLKAIYYEGDTKNTLLYHQLLKCSYADKIVLVGGYKSDDLQAYCDDLESKLKDKLTIVTNDHFEDLASGYSLYVGLKEAFKHNPDEILFIEGDLDTDFRSFVRVVSNPRSVLTYNYEPIYANKAVVLYRDDEDHYQYAFNSSHGLLTIESSFSCILNSGQTWKFTEIDKLKKAADKFYEEVKGDTNLKIIQNYLDQDVAVDVVPIDRWTNCNTREDYRKIVKYWEAENEDTN